MAAYLVDLLLKDSKATNGIHRHETTNIIDFARRDGITDALTDLLRTGAQPLIATAVEAELAGYLVQFSDLRIEAAHAAVVRNGHQYLQSYYIARHNCKRARLSDYVYYGW